MLSNAMLDSCVSKAAMLDIAMPDMDVLLGVMLESATLNTIHDIYVPNTVALNLSHSFLFGCMSCAPKGEDQFVQG